jgi:hypothetical protein
MIRRRRALPALGLAGRTCARPEAGDVCSFSQGEKVRMRASREEFCLVHTRRKR